MENSLNELTSEQIESSDLIVPYRELIQIGRESYVFDGNKASSRPHRGKSGFAPGKKGENIRQTIKRQAMGLRI